MVHRYTCSNNSDPLIQVGLVRSVRTICVRSTGADPRLKVREGEAFSRNTSNAHTFYHFFHTPFFFCYSITRTYSYNSFISGLCHSRLKITRFDVHISIFCGHFKIHRSLLTPRTSTLVGRRPTSPPDRKSIVLASQTRPRSRHHLYTVTFVLVHEKKKNPTRQTDRCSRCGLRRTDPPRVECSASSKALSNR